MITILLLQDKNKTNLIQIYLKLIQFKVQTNGNEWRTYY